MLLFSYGSNSPQQLAMRLGHPVQGEAAYLPRHRRVFRGHSYNWNGGVASVVPDAGRHVFGFVFEADDDDVAILDQYEGVDTGYYTRDRITVTMADGSQRAASVYKATSTEPSKPSRRYLKTIADTVGSFWAGDITWRSFPTANDGRGPRKRGRSARRGRASAMTLHGHTFDPDDLSTFVEDTGYSEWPDEVLAASGFVSCALEDIIVRLRKLRFPLTVYRGLGLPVGAHPRLVAKGSWTYSRAVGVDVAHGRIEAAGSPEGPIPWLLTGTVPSPDRVDWDTTINWNFRFDDESELHLWSTRAPVDITAERV